MKAIILAAGSSKRLRPVCDSIPKSLIIIDGRSLLERNIDNLLLAGVERIIVVVGYLKEIMISRIKNRYTEIEFVENPVYHKSGSGYSLCLGMEHIKTAERIVFMDADILYHPLIINDIKTLPHPSTIYIGANECDEEAVKVALDKEGVVSRISKNIENPTECAGESIGIVTLGSDGMGKVQKLLRGEIEKGNIDFEWEHILDDNSDSLSLHSEITTLPWIEIDFPEDIAKAEEVARNIAEQR